MPQGRGDRGKHTWRREGENLETSAARGANNSSTFAFGRHFWSGDRLKLFSPKGSHTQSATIKGET